MNIQRTRRTTRNHKG